MKKDTYKHLVIGALMLCLLAVFMLFDITPAEAAIFCVLPFFGATKVVDGLSHVDTLKVAHTAATVADTVYLISGRPVLAVNSELADVDNTFVYRGRIRYAKVSAQAWAAGVTLYWDDTAKNFTTVLTANTKCGIAAEDAANPSSEGIIDLMPELNVT